MVLFWWRHGRPPGPPLRYRCVSGLDQQGRLPLHRVAQVHGQALILLFIVTNQIVQTLEKCLLQTSCCLKEQQQQAVNNTGGEEQEEETENVNGGDELCDCCICLLYKSCL